MYPDKANDRNVHPLLDTHIVQVSTRAKLRGIFLAFIEIASVGGDIDESDIIWE